MLRAVASQILSGTWANKPSSAAQGSLYFASDVGEHGTMFQYGVSRWRALNGTTALKQFGTAVTGIVNSESIVLQGLLPAGAWQTNDVVRLWIAGGKSGTTDSAQLTVRVGTAGTTSDTAITGISTLILGAAANVSFGLMFDVKLVSATSAQKVGANLSSTGSYQGAGSGAVATATTITDASANALYVSAGVRSSGATDTVSIHGGFIQLVTA